MKARQVLAEALRNLRAHALLSSLCVMAVVVASGLAFAGSAGDVDQILKQQDALVLRGANVWAVVPTDTNRTFAAKRCDQLNQLDAVEAAGAVMSTAKAQPLSGAGVQVQYGTPKLADVYWPSSTPHSAATVGALVAATHGLGSASTWAMRIGHTYMNLPTATAQTTTRNQSWNGYVVIPEAPSGQTNACWVEATAGHRDGVEALLLGWWSGTNVKVTPLFEPSGSSLTPQEQLTGRLSQAFPVLGGVLIIITLMANWVIRRSEFALYSLEGLRRSQLLWQASVDVFVLAYLPTVVTLFGVFFCVELISPRGLALELLAMDAAKVLSMVLLAPPLALLVIGTRDAVARLKGQ